MNFYLKCAAPGDVLERNTDKTLDLVWQLILHYHIDCHSQQHTQEGSTRRKNLCKQSMLVWVNAILPGRNITNFSTDWCDGENLVALINFCKPGLLNPDDNRNHPYEMLVQAMQASEKVLSVPQVLSADDLFVDQPDEVSVMTYLSYFCRTNSPGEKVLLEWVQQEIPNEKITNLTSNWVSGVSLGALVNKLTHDGFPQYRKFSSTTPLANCQESMKEAGELLKVPSTVSADSLSSDDVAYLPMVAYLVQFYAAQNGKPVTLKADVSKVKVSGINLGEEQGEAVVWIDLDCSNAGQAQIKANVITEMGKEIAVSVREVDAETDQYRIRFPVEEGVDVYTFSVQYGGEEVNGSPFHVNLTTASATKVQHVSTDKPEEVKEGESVVLGFDTKDAGYGRLTAKASGECAGSVPIQLVQKPKGGFDVLFTPPIPDVYSIDVLWGKMLAIAKGQSCGSIPIELQQDSKRDFKLSFEPPTPDVYTVDVMWGGEPVPGSPFTINLLPPPQPEKVETGDPMFGGVGEMVDLPVDLTHAGPGVLTATCNGEKVGNVETSIISISRKLHQVTFLASQMDIYHLSVLFNDMHIRGSPVRINLTQKMHGTTIPEPTHYMEIGSPMIVEVPIKDGEKKAKITVTAFGEETGSCGTVVKKNTKGNYDVIFDPKTPDIYTISVQLNDKTVPECCYTVKYSPCKVSKRERCRLMIDTKEFSKQLFDIDSDVHLAVDTCEAGHGSLEVRIVAPDEQQYEVEVKPKEEDKTKFDISYVPKVAGTHHLSILWDGKDIPQSPLPIMVVDLAGVLNFSHGKTVLADIELPSDAKEKDVKTSVTHVSSGSVCKSHGRYTRGNYQVSFNPKQPGLYSINARIRGKELPSNPHVIRYGDPPRPQQCTVKDLPQNAYVGRETSFTVDASKCGSGELNIKTITHKLLKKDKSKVSWKESGETGVYVVTVTPTTVGTLTLLVTWAGTPIPRTPHNITVSEPLQPKEVVPKPTARVYTVDLTSNQKAREQIDPIPNVVDCFIGQALLVQVPIASKPGGILTHIGSMMGILKDDEEVKVTVNGEKTGPQNVKVQRSHDDTFDVVFAPTGKDTYVVSVHYEDQEVTNSPITAVFGDAPTDPTKVEVTELGELNCFVNQEFKFEADANRAGVGPLSVLAQAPGTEEKTPVHVKEEGNHRYSIRYLPRITGRHLLHLLWGGTAIPKSPLTVEVNELTTVPPGKPASFEITAGKWKFSDIEAIGTHLDTGRRYEVKRKQKKGRYIFSLKPDEPGIYEIALQVEGKNIVRPFRFRYDRPSLPEKVVVFGFKEEGTVNETIVFKVDVSEAGIGPLKIDIDGPGKKTKTRISDCEDGIHTVRFTAYFPGKYRLRITWNGEEVISSPFSIVILDKKRKSEHHKPIWHRGFQKKRSSGDSDSTDSLDSIESPDTRPNWIGFFERSDEKESDESEPEQIAVEELQTEKETSVTIGRPSRWEIDISQLDGQLEVTAVGEKTGEADILLTQIQEGVFQATFHPTKPDRYKISVLLNGKHMSNSPIFVNYELLQTDAKKVKIVGLNKIPPIIPVGEKVCVLVDTQDAGLGELKLNAKPPQSKEKTHTLEIDNYDDNPAIYDISYVPEIVGIHYLELLFPQTPVSGSPLQLKAFDPQQVTYSYDETSAIKVGEPIKIQFDTSKSGYDDLTATCEGVNCGVVDVSVTTGKDTTKHNISFKPVVEDLYSLTVKLGPYDIRGSPFRFNLSAVDVEKIKLTGPLQPDGPKGPVKLVVNTTNLPQGKLVSVCKYNEETVSVKVKEISRNVFSLSFQPVDAARYTWSVMFHGQHIPGSPFVFDTTPRPEKIEVVSPEPGSIGIGQYVIYEVDISSAGMGALTATCNGEKSKKIPVEITQIRQSVFTVSFLPLSYDKYSLYIQWSGRELPNSPFEYEIDPPKQGVTTKQVEIPVLLPPIDDTSAVDVTCSGEKYGTIAVKLIPVSENKYRISFKPLGPDLYTLNVLLNGLHVKRSPFSFDLRAAEKPLATGDVNILSDSTTASSPKHKPTKPPKEYKMTIGSALVVNIRTEKRNQGGNKVAATAVGNGTGEAKINVEKFSEGYFEVNFNPKIPDTYTVTITLNGEQLVQSPIIVHYNEAPPSPNNVHIVGLEDLTSVLEVNKEVSAVINATKAGNGTLRVEVKGPKDTKVDVKPRKDESEMFSISFTPTVGGIYTLSLFWNDEHVPNSPLTLRVVDTSAAIRSLPGTPISIDNIEIQCSPTDIKAYAVRRDSTTKLKVKTKQVRKHLYRITFSHDKPGYYYIHILAQGTELAISPIPVYIASPPYPKKCVVESFPSVAFIKEEIAMLVNCTEGGEGTLEARVVGPKKLEKALAPVDNKNGTYTIKYVPNTEGTYHFHITWSRQAIYKSPYKLSVKKPTQEELPISEVYVINLADHSHSVTGDEEITISMDDSFVFGIRLTKKQGRLFIARAISKEGDSLDFSLLQCNDNYYKFSFKPPSPGLYTLEFSLGDLKLQLPQLPHRLNVVETEVDASKITILRHTLPGLLLVNRKIFFQVDTRLAGSGRMKVNLEGPSVDSASMHLEPTPNKPRFYDVYFTPIATGMYHLKLLWDDVVVPGFPLALDVTSPNIKHGNSSSIEIPLNSLAKGISSYAIHVQTGDKLDVEIHQVSKRRYRFDFHPKLSGAYNLHVFVGSDEIPGSPFPLIYGEPLQPWNVIVKKMSKFARVDSEVSFDINVLNAGDGHLGIKVRGPESEGDQKIRLTESSNCTFKATFTPRTVGEYSVQITWSDSHVPNSPFRVNVTERGMADELKTWISEILDDDLLPVEEEVVIEENPGTTGSYEESIPLPPSINLNESDLSVFRKRHTVGKIISFSIMHNGYPDNLTIQSKGTTDLEIKTIKGSNENTYEINPKAAGAYELVFLWNGSIVSGGPYILYFDMPRRLCGLNWQDKVFSVGKSYQCTIITNDISPGMIEFSCETPDAAEIVITAMTSSEYQCTLCPKMAGEFKISVFYNGFQIQGSPFLVHFKQPSAFNLKFNLQAEGIEIDDVSAVLESITTQQSIPVSLQQLFGGECSLEFVPTEGDEYTLTITCGLKIKREKIAGSPFNLTYLPLEENASMCRIEGVGTSGALDEWSKFVVNCEGAGPGPLTAKFNAEGAEVRVVSVSKYTYEVQYCIRAGGNYQLQVQWGGQDIPGSQLQLSVASTASPQSLRVSNIPSQVQAKEPIEFDIEPQGEMSAGDLTVEATTTSGTTVKGTLTLKESSCRVSIPTREPGEYSIAINYKGTSVLQEPIKIRVVVPGESLLRKRYQNNGPIETSA